MKSEFVATQERRARALLGFMDEQDAVTFLKGMSDSAGKSDDDLRTVWKGARSAVERPSGS